MTPSLGREAGRLRRAFKRAAWLAFAATQATVGYAACGGEKQSSSASEGGHQVTTTGSSSSAGGGGGGGGKGGGGGSGGGTGGARDCTPQPFLPDASDDCGAFMHLPCGLPDDVPLLPDCFLPTRNCPELCGVLAFYCHAVNDSCQDGGVIVNDTTHGVDLDCTICANGVGRAPEGFAPRGGRGARSSIGAYVALAAELEAASVFAFDRLALELASAGAPARLVAVARRSARDERRHARRTTGVARALGGAPVRSRRIGNEPRALEAVALENAVEGCVKETFGALIASWQGEHAEDPAIAALSRGLAADETRHAALSWGVGRWCWTRLAPASRRRIAGACKRAIAELRTMPRPHEPVARAAGLPSAAEHRALVDALEATLWRDLVNGGRRGLARA